MQISCSFSQRNNLKLGCYLVFVMIAMSGFALLAAEEFEPKTSAHEKESAPAPQATGHIFIVNTTNDAVDVAPGDGLCDTDINTPGEQCSLRAAIIEANALAGDDVIRFELPPSDPGCHFITGECVIPFSTALPDISTNIEFDGPGAKVFQLLPRAVRAFRITTNGTVTFSGLTINGGVAGVGVGGNILNVNAGTVNIINCDIVQGHANAGRNAAGASTFGGAHNLPVPIVRLNEFLSDTQNIGLGVVVGQGNWEQILENNKHAFTTGFVQRTRFTTAFPGSLTPAQFVDSLNANAGNPLSQAERDQLVSDLTNGVKTRAQVLRAVAEDVDLFNGESNRAFVLMQYFGYLRRNPNDPQDTDYTGFDFWLTKLNQFNGNFINAEMVKAFITSGEYRQRLGP